MTHDNFLTNDKLIQLQKTKGILKEKEYFCYQQQTNFSI